MQINKKIIATGLAVAVVTAGIGYLFYGQLQRPKPNTSDAAGAGSISFTTITPMDATSPESYGTFQSNSQKVVQNQHGIFVSYLKWVDESVPQESKNVWAISRSQDGGATFSQVYQENAGSRAPALETDSSGNVYTLAGDWSGSGAGKLHKFGPGNGFTAPIVTTVIPNMACCKYTLAIDESKGQLYAFRWGGEFAVIGMDGSIRSAFKLVENSDHTNVQYPNLYVDNGVLYAAWTTQRLDRNHYWSIQFMLSRDGGTTWEKPGGTAIAIPVPSDETGPTTRITLDDEFEASTYLAGFLVKNSKAHFMYYAGNAPPREHYVRLDVASGQVEKNTYPRFGGETIEFLYLDGYCTSRSDIQNIYCVSSNGQGKIGIIYSSDGGDTWHDWAQSPEANKGAYSISGGFRISSNGYILGAYTQTGVTPAVIQFFKSSTTTQAPTPTPTATPTPTPTPTPTQTPIPTPSNTPDLSISASPSSIQAGQSTTVTWVCKSTPAVCNISKDGSLIWSGNPGQSAFDTGPLNKNTTYTISTVTASRSVTVTVSTEDKTMAPNIIKPSTGATLQGNNIEFSWNDTGAESYNLVVYRTQDNKELLRYEGLKNTSITASGIPADGTGITVRISGIKNGVEKSNAYNYTTSNIPSPTPATLTVGTSFKYPNSPAVYYLSKQNCKELYSSWKMLTVWGEQSNSIRIISESIQFPSCGFVKPPVNSVVKPNGPIIYLFDGSALRPFTTWQSFIGRGFALKNIISIAQEELTGYSIGEPIK